MERLANIEHHIIRRIDDIVDTALTDRFEALFEPIRRRADFHTFDISSDVSTTEAWLLNRNGYRIRLRF